MNHELRQLRRMAMYGVPERLGMSFSGGGFEMRAKPNGTAAGSAFEFNGYATVYNAPFPMWDQAGEPFTEVVAPGAAKRSLNNPALDVPFLIGHDDSGIPMARTKSGTMRLSEDSRGVHVHVPAMDGRREDVRALASAVERGDMSEMSLAFICNRQAWDDAYEQRTILEMDLHRGDVCAVVHGANPATDGSWMASVEQLSFRRPAAIGGPVLLDRERRAVTQADRDKANAAGNSLPDGSYPINNVDQLKAAAVLAASHHGDWKAAQALIRRRAKELGVDVSTLPGFGEEHAASGPYELRASAADDTSLSTAPDYDAADAVHDYTCPSCQSGNDSDAIYCDQCGQSMAGSSTIVVDAATGIPGEESQYAAARDLERMHRELELELLARR